MFGGFRKRNDHDALVEHVSACAVKQDAVLRELKSINDGLGEDRRERAARRERVDDRLRELETDNATLKAGQKTLFRLAWGALGAGGSALIGHAVAQTFWRAT